MFVSSGQFYVFLACIGLGGLSGVIFSLFLPLRIVLNSFCRIIVDVISFCIVSVLFVWVSYLLRFPSFRLYMPIGVLIGLFIYAESFNIILAKIIKKLYNIINKKILKWFRLIKAKISKKPRTKDEKLNGAIKG